MGMVRQVSRDGGVDPAGCVDRLTITTQITGIHTSGRMRLLDTVHVNPSQTSQGMKISWIFRFSNDFVFWVVVLCLSASADISVQRARPILNSDLLLGS